MSSGELSFSQVAAALQRKGTATEGCGNTLGWAARDESGHLAPFKFTRRTPGADDVVIQIAFSGICHSDLHLMCNDFGSSSFPMVPG